MNFNCNFFFKIATSPCEPRNASGQAQQQIPVLRQYRSLPQ